VLAHLFWHDVKQNLRAIRILPLLGLTMYLAYRDMGHEVERRYADIPGALSRYRFFFFTVLPLLAGLMGASLADERRKGITLTILARGVSRSQYLRSKMLAAVVSAAFFILIAIGIFYAIIIVVWLPNRETWGNHSYSTFNPFFLPVENLVVHDIIVALMLMLAPAALCLVGVLAGLVVANEYVAMVSPPIFTILLAVLMPHISEVLNPERYLLLLYAHGVPQWLIPFVPFLYWSGFSLIIVIVCRRIIAKKEIA